jgi:ABC-type amino acid transport system permease subunit
VLAFVGINDLVSAGLTIRMRTFEILPVWIVIGIIYLIWITAVSKLMDVVYEKKKVPGIELDLQS